MGTTVEIPIRVRLDAAALGDGIGVDALVADALRAAAGRALARAAETVPAAARTAEEPRLHWHGHASAGARTRVERAVRDAIADALAAAASAPAHGDPLTTAAAGLSERADPDRLLPLAGQYVVPAYEDAGEPVALPVATASPDAPPPPGAATGFATPPDDWTEEQYIDALLRAVVRTHVATPAHGFVVLMYGQGADAEGHPRYGMRLFEVEGQWESVETVAWRRSWFTTWEATADGAEQRAATLSPADDLSLIAHVGSPEEIARIRADHLRDVLTQAYEDEGVRSGLPAAERDRLRDEAIAAAVAAIRIEPGERGVFRLQVGDRTFLGSLGEGWDALPSGVAVPIVPLLAPDLIAGPPAPAGEPQWQLGEAFTPSEGGRCEPYDDEPSLDQLGAGGLLIRRLIARLAEQLGIARCEYAGTFALGAAQSVADKAVAIDELTRDPALATLRLVGGGEGNLGAVDFERVDSPEFRDLRALAAVLPQLAELVRAIADVYRAPEHAGLLTDPDAWVESFGRAMANAKREAAAALFVSACRAVLLQLLRTSAAAIAERLDSVDASAVLYEVALLAPLRELSELEHLRSLLRPATTIANVLPGPEPADGAEPHAAWTAAAETLLQGVDALTADTAAPAPGPDRIEWGDDGIPRAADAQGRRWTLTELDQLITLKHGVVESMDPLLEQLDADDRARLIAPGTDVARELTELLESMAVLNREQDRLAVADRYRAFSVGALTTGLPGVRVPGAPEPLQGIHLQAHIAVGAAFGGDRSYPDGLTMLFGEASMREAAKGIGVFAGVLAIAVLCPPLGLAASVFSGMAVAAAGLGSVAQRELLYRSLIQPDLVLNWAALERERFLILLNFSIGLVLDLVPLPELDQVIREAGRVARRGESLAIRTGAISAERAVAAELTEELVEMIGTQLANRLVYGMLAGGAADALLRAVLDPVTRELEALLVEQGPVGGMAGAEQRLEELMAR